MIFVIFLLSVFMSSNSTYQAKVSLAKSGRRLSKLAIDYQSLTLNKQSFSELLVQVRYRKNLKPIKKLVHQSNFLMGFYSSSSYNNLNLNNFSQQILLHDKCHK